MTIPRCIRWHTTDATPQHNLRDKRETEMLFLPQDEPVTATWIKANQTWTRLWMSLVFRKSGTIEHLKFLSLRKKHTEIRSIIFLVIIIFSSYFWVMKCYVSHNALSCCSTMRTRHLFDLFSSKVMWTHNEVWRKKSSNWLHEGCWFRHFLNFYSWRTFLILNFSLLLEQIKHKACVFHPSFLKIWLLACLDSF